MMRLRFDRNVMRWFDVLFENNSKRVSNENFIYRLVDIDANTGREYSIISIEKEYSNYWKLEFILPKSYVYTIKKNIHPLFNEYIYEESTIYGNNKIYTAVNNYLVNLMDFVTSSSYDAFENVYYIEYSKEFYEISKTLEQGIGNKIADDIYILVKNNENIDFTNKDGSIRLNLKYSSILGEDLLDSLIDLKKSILITE